MSDAALNQVMNLMVAATMGLILLTLTAAIVACIVILVKLR